LQTGLFGAFTAQNFFHWFLFYEASLVPAWFLVKLWGGERRNQAAFQFFVYTMLGSVALLLAFSALFLGAGTFEFNELAAQAHAGLLFPKLTQALHWPASAPTLGWLLFALAFLGFAVKVPLVPFHSWLPATYQQAEAPVTMLLTGVMSKLGVYGFLRIVQPIFPEALATLQVPLLGLAVFSVVFAAGAALAQTDLKRVLAWSSVNHLGYCLLAFFALSTDGPPADRAAALSGIILQIFNHGLTAAALFWGAHLLERRTGTLEFARLGGLRAPAPVFCGLLGIAIFSSLGLPGLNGFIGEFLIFKGVFALTPWAGACAVLGLLITAVFLLQALQKVFYGPVPDHLARVPDLSIAERLHWAPVIGLMLGLGIYPQALLWLLQGTLNAWTTK
jgi:NADH-quinone oxidoreductase subunit M